MKCCSQIFHPNRTAPTIIQAVHCAVCIVACWEGSKKKKLFYMMSADVVGVAAPLVSVDGFVDRGSPHPWEMICGSACSQVRHLLPSIRFNVIMVYFVV